MVRLNSIHPSPPGLPSGCSCFLGTAVMEWGMDMALRRKPAGRVSIEPAIIPRPWPSLGLKRLRHDGDLRNDLSSFCDDITTNGFGVISPHLNHTVKRFNQNSVKYSENLHLPLPDAGPSPMIRDYWTPSQESAWPGRHQNTGLSWKAIMINNPINWMVLQLALNCYCLHVISGQTSVGSSPECSAWESEEWGPSCWIQRSRRGR